jgi:hypothetical protein
VVHARPPPFDSRLDLVWYRAEVMPAADATVGLLALSCFHKEESATTWATHDSTPPASVHAPPQLRKLPPCVAHVLDVSALDGPESR